MTREDIIKLAREQGLPETEVQGVFMVNTDDLGRLLAAERERLTVAAFAAAEKAIDAAIAAEREAVLDLVDEYAKNNADLKAAIRARKELK